MNRKSRMKIIERIKLSPMKRCLKVGASFLVLMNISACSVYKSQFDCAPGKGVGCHSVSKVNDLINDDSLDDFIEGRQEIKKKALPVQNNATERKEKSESCNSCSKPRTNHNPAKQNKEKVTIWFKEYEDKQGVLHGAHEKHIFFEAGPTSGKRVHMKKELQK